MSRIDFQQVATPNFGNSNDLLKLAMEQSNKAVTGLTDTWEQAAGAVQNRNHADIQSLINQQTPEQLNSIEGRQALEQQIQGVVGPGGNVYDPLLMNAYADNRSDVLVGRGNNQLTNMGLNLDVQSKTQSNAFTSVENAYKVKELQAEEATRDSAMKVAKQSERMTGLIQMHEFFNRKINSFPEGSAERQAARDEQTAAIKKTYGNVTIEEVSQVYNSISDSINKNTKTGLEQQILGQRLDIGNEQIAASVQNRGNKDVNTAVMLEDREKDDLAARQAVVTKPGFEGELIAQPGGGVVRDWAQTNNRVVAQLNSVIDKIENPNKITNFNEYVLSTKDKNGKVPDANNIAAFNKALGNYGTEYNKQFTPAEQYTVYSKLAASGGIGKAWYNKGFFEERNAKNKLKTAVDSMYAENGAQINKNLKSYYNGLFNQLNTGEGRTGIVDSAIMIGVTKDHPHFDLMPKAVQNVLGKKK